MKQYITIATLGVSDIAKATEFYEKIGWKNTKESNENITFMQGHNIVLGLYAHSELAKDANVEIENEQLPKFRGVSFAVNKHSEKEVDEFFENAVKCGAKPQKKPEKAFWGGYSGYIADRDGHLWEIAHNPFFKMDKNGQVKLD